MKTPLAYLFLLVLLIGCKNEHQLTLTPIKFTGESCNGCPEVSIEVPRALQRSMVSNNINAIVSEEITSILLFGESEDSKTHGIESAIESFTDANKEIADLYDIESNVWEATIEGKVSYEDKNKLTLVLNSYLFTGGAHGYQSIRFLNFDKKTGKELENWQIFNNQDAFESLAEKTFREVEGIPFGESINSTGFMFERDSFYLPENIGFTKDGIKLLYNQFEVSSFADGPLEIVLPYREAKKFLKNNLKTEAIISSTTFEDSE